MSTDAALKVDPDQLPHDVDALKSLVVQLIESLQGRDRRIAQLEHHMDLLVRKVYGRTSEKVDPGQLALFDKQPEEQAAVPEPPIESAAPGKRRGHGRRPKPDTLERRDVIHDLGDAEKQALAGDSQGKLGTRCRHSRVLRYHQPTMAAEIPRAPDRRSSDKASDPQVVAGWRVLG
jgi:hypothetical protein